MSSVNRRTFLKSLSTVPLALARAKASPMHGTGSSSQNRPNILILMSDNHSWNHLGCYGDPVVQTPHIDQMADRGVRFTHGFCAAPSCAPARAGMLSGQDVWRLEEGANLWGVFPDKFPLYTDMLEADGYHVGAQGKGWGPGSVEMSGRKKNHAGEKYASFEAFLEANNGDDPWCFWYSTSDPHRPYELGSGAASGMDLGSVPVPDYLPDNETVRSDIADYYVEVQQFDRDVGRIISRLKETGQYENTLVVICSDNGWQMPRGLANLYDFGTRVPLIISWEGRIPGGRVVDDFVNLNDLAPTFLELAGLDIPKSMTATSLGDLLFSGESGRVEDDRDHVVTARERHALCRAWGKGYPGRALRTHDHLYIRNYEPDRWPAGDPPLFGDVDAHMLHYPCPTKMFMLEHREDPEVRPLFELGFMKRPAEELYDLQNDPYQMENVAASADYRAVKNELSGRLETYLKETRDPRATGGEIIWDTTMYYQPRDFRPRPGEEAIERLGLKEQYNYFG